MNIYGCELIASKGICLSEDKKIIQMFEEYCQRLNMHPEDTVWYDVEDRVCFSSDLDYSNSSPQEACFLTNREQFLSNFRHGIPHFETMAKKGYDLGDIDFTDELIMEKSEAYEKYKNSKILIVGSGPSAHDLEIESLEYDYIWVCNHFFKNPSLATCGPSLFYMSNEVDKYSFSFEIMENNKDMISLFDINVGRNYQLLSNYKKAFGNRSILFSTRMFTTIGTVPRLINLACFFGAKEIKIAGLDGNSKEDYQNGTSVYKFEGTKNIPSLQSYGSQRREYILFWEYIRKNYPKVKLHNLGNHYEHNVSKHILGRI
jgi:hypothetical protein